MPGVGVEFGGIGPEVARDPDLMELLGDQVLDESGMTLRDLAEMCPLDLTSPDITTEAKNQYIVVDIYNKGEHSVPQELAPLFSRIVQDRGLEQTFTIATPNKLESGQTEVITTKQHSEQIRTQSNEAIKVRSVTDAVRQEQTIQRLMLVETLAAVKTVSEAPNEPRTESKTLARQQEAMVSNPDGVTTGFQPDNEPPNKQDNLEGEIPSLLEAQFDVVIDTPTQFFEDHVSPDIVPTVPSELPEDVPITVQMWAEELSKEADEVYDDFTEALLAFETAFLLSESNEALLTNQPEAEMQTAPEIVGVVAERLKELELGEREEAAQILKNIVGAIHGLQLLEAREAEPQTVEMVEAQLRELCLTLFEAIGIEYDEQDIEEFMGVLMHKDFRPAKADEPEAGLIDLENIGTREAKHSTHYAGDKNARTQLKQIIGMFAVIRHVPKPEKLMDTTTTTAEAA